MASPDRMHDRERRSHADVDKDGKENASAYVAMCHVVGCRWERCSWAPMHAADGRDSEPVKWGASCERNWGELR
jgi:hypothetical protein